MPVGNAMSIPVLGAVILCILAYAVPGSNGECVKTSIAHGDLVSNDDSIDEPDENDDGSITETEHESDDGIEKIMDKNHGKELEVHVASPDSNPRYESQL
jgi:hypothetical protein